jgi:hypothetical protein
MTPIGQPCACGPMTWLHLLFFQSVFVFVGQTLAMGAEVRNLRLGGNAAAPPLPSDAACRPRMVTPPAWAAPPPKATKPKQDVAGRKAAAAEAAYAKAAARDERRRAAAGLGLAEQLAAEDSVVGRVVCSFA